MNYNHHKENYSIIKIIRVFSKVLVLTKEPQSYIWSVRLLIKNLFHQTIKFKYKDQKNFHNRLKVKQLYCMILKCKLTMIKLCNKIVHRHNLKLIFQLKQTENTESKYKHKHYKENLIKHSVSK